MQKSLYFGWKAFDVWSLMSMLSPSFVVTRALFRALCSGVSVFVFGLYIKLMETILQLVVLVVAVTVGPGCG